jgi:hypothetical protein
MAGKPTDGTAMFDFYAIGSYATALKQHPGMSWGDQMREAYLGAISDAGMKNGAAVETAWPGNCDMRFWLQDSIRGQALFKPNAAYDRIDAKTI